jgi:hypothetical protein
MAAHASSPRDGVQVVGIHGGISGDQYPRLVVNCADVSTGELRRREIEVRGFNPATGEPTEVGLSLQKVHPGERIAVGVFTDVRNFTYRRSTERHAAGEAGQMVTLSAMWIESLEV